MTTPRESSWKGRRSSRERVGLHYRLAGYRTARHRLGLCAQIGRSCQVNSAGRAIAVGLDPGLYVHGQQCDRKGPFFLHVWLLLLVTTWPQPEPMLFFKNHIENEPILSRRYDCPESMLCFLNSIQNESILSRRYDCPKLIYATKQPVKTIYRICCCVGTFIPASLNTRPSNQSRLYISKMLLCGDLRTRISEYATKQPAKTLYRISCCYCSCFCSCFCSCYCHVVIY